jgi:hypothetical protein
MANTVIQLKYSSTPGNIPSGLANGEIALNYADGRFYYKNLTGQIVSFSGSGNVYSFSTINANGSLITALSNNSILTLSNGNNIEITGNIISDIITISANLKPAFDTANAAFGEANIAYTLANNAYNYANTISAASGSGYIYSTIFTFPTGDLGTGETYPGSSGATLTDAFGVNLSQVYECMEPVGQIKVTDLDVLT